MPTIRNELVRIRETPLPELIEEAKTKALRIICNNVDFEQELDEDSFELLSLLLSQTLELVVRENDKLKFRPVVPVSDPAYDLQKYYLDNRGW